MATTVTVTKGLIGLEDLSVEAAGSAPTTFNRTKSGGGTISITKLGPVHLKLQDAGSLITGTNVEEALQEIAGDIDDLEEWAGKGADIASAATIALPSKHLYFDVTGTTNISTITIDTGGVAGRLVVLQFDSSLTVLDSSNLRLEEDFTTQTGDHLLLLYDGTNWRELARTAKHGVDIHEGPLEARNTELGDMQITGDADKLFTAFVAINPDIHDGPFEARDVETVGPVQVTGDVDVFHTQKFPLNGFIGGQNDRSFS